MTTIQTTPKTIEGTSGTRAPAVAGWRLIVVELRKLVDTRAGMWLLIIMALAAVATVAILFFAAPAAEQTFAGFFAFALVPGIVLLPVLGILSMTGEFSQRTALTTFALVPTRTRIIGAKLAAAAIVAIASTAVVGVVAAVGNLLAAGLHDAGDWSIDAAVVGQSLLLMVIYVLMGSAFGALLLNSPLAIVAYFTLPTLWSLLGSMVRWLRSAAGWLDTGVTSVPLETAGVTAGEWARFGTSVAVWLLVPLALGTVRILRREIS